LGVLVQDEREGTVQFYHQTLHGYFALPGLLKALQPHWLDGVRRYRLENMFRGIADLGEAGAPAVPTLIEKLKDESEWMRRQAAWALGSIGAPAAEATSSLIDALRDRDWGVRLSAALVLGIVESVEAVPMLVHTLGDPKSDVRQSVVWALGQIGTVEAIRALINALDDLDYEVSESAEQALGNIGVSAIEFLVEALKDLSRMYVRSNLVRALGNTKAPEAVAPLSDILRGSDSNMCWGAASALSNIGMPALPALVGALYDPDIWIHRSAAWALDIIDLPEARAALEMWRQEQRDGKESDDDATVRNPPTSP
jgi:HEAT repeat protein